ncbi:C6 transcription factor [Aspergillus japonicus CBS 114.51]|uniref:C6 transcription factor n=1 Tax=Aspergillus japonicus CBS 114.51 TaxID=1448312 RepID=A0A8T8WTK8_ASPJA|nr:C6 transcription factor [Aspergillus japonicus CBS 114.51]RAH79178.1 C6 transcription factor [Aspergillus japonicus CBS 114.51]
MELPVDKPTAHGPASKRRRVALACDVCRTRKSRCDGMRPHCSMCKDLGFECVYTPSVTTTNIIVQKDYLQDLEARIKSLENSHHRMQSDLSGLVAHRTTRKRSPPSDSEPESGHEPLADLTGPEDPIDAMGAVTFADEEECGYFGPSSNIAFLRHLSRAVSHSRGDRQAEINSPAMHGTGDNGGFVSATRQPSPMTGSPTATPMRSPPTTNPLLLPSDEIIPLIRRYFADTGLLFPYIYPPAFLETYHQFKSKAKKPRRTWLGLLNIVLAMATLTAVFPGYSAETRIQESTVYYQQALRLCQGEIMRGTTLEAVQFLLLMGQYLQGTQKSVQAWTLHGLAVKAALQLGLHSKEASKVFPPLERDTRQRTWFGCVVLDRTLSMTFGRPPAIPDKYVQLDLPQLDILGDCQAFVDDETLRCSTGFFNHTITLYKHMGTIIDQIYGANLGCEPSLPVVETVGRVLSIENQLLSWVATLPDCLRQVTFQALCGEIARVQPQPPLYPLKFRVILTLRYLHVQILLHRPILVRFLDATHTAGLEPGEERILNEIGYSSMKKCVESGMEIINIIHEVVTATGWPLDLLGAWWYSLYYTFNAALVITGAIWIQRARESAHTFQMYRLAHIEDLELYPARAVAILRHLDTGNRMVDRCRYYLEQLISILGIQSDDPARTVPADHNLSGMSSANNVLDYSSLGIECGEYMLDELFVTMARQTPSEGW